MMSAASTYYVSRERARERERPGDHAPYQVPNRCYKYNKPSVYCHCWYRLVTTARNCLTHMLMSWTVLHKLFPHQ